MSDASDKELGEQVFKAVCSQLELVIGQDVACEEVKTQRATERAVGAGQIHISFRLSFQLGGRDLFGALLVPLPDAISLAAFLLMVPNESVEAQRDAKELDETLKDAMLEIGNFVGGAVAGVVRERVPDAGAVRTRGCQGVRADIRPAFPYEEGSPLLVGRCQSAIGEFPSFEMVLMMPPLDDAQDGSQDAAPDTAA